MPFFFSGSSFSCVSVASNDYTSGPFTVTIPAGQTAVNLTIATITDGVIEMTEQFNLMIMDTSDPSVVVGPDAIAMVTIEDTDGE